MDWRNRPNKELVRKYFLSHVPKDKPINYMGLPASEAIFEKKMARYRNVEGMVLLEKEPLTFTSLRKNTKKLSEKVKTQYVLGEADSFIFSNMSLVPSLNVIWLDYCGPISDTRIALANQILKKSSDDLVLGLTFLCARESKKFYSSFDLSLDVYMRRIHAFTSLIDCPVSIECQPYFDNVPMLLFVIKKAIRKSLTVFPALRS